MGAIETMGAAAAAVAALVCTFGLGFVVAMHLFRGERKEVDKATDRAIEVRRADQAFDVLHETARSYEADEAIDILRSLSKILKRAGEARGPEPAARTLGNTKRMQDRTAPPDWESGEREVDGRGPAGLCEARNVELRQHARLLEAKLVDPPAAHQARSFDEDVALARQRRLAEPAIPLPIVGIEKQLEAARTRGREEWSDE